MIRLETLETLSDILNVFKEVTPLLENPKNIDNLIEGVASAREVINKRNDAQKVIDKAEIVIEKQQTILDKIQKTREAQDLEKLDLETFKQTLDVIRLAQEETSKLQLETEEAQEKTRIDQERRGAILLEREGTIKTDLEEAARQKQIYTDAAASIAKLADTTKGE